MQCPTALCDCKKSGWLVSGGALYFGEWAVETDCVGKPCEFWAELIRRFSSTDVTINIVILFFSCEELNVQIVSVLNLMDITSKFWIITVFFFCFFFFNCWLTNNILSLLCRYVYGLSLYRRDNGLSSNWKQKEIFTQGRCFTFYPAQITSMKEVLLQHIISGPWLKCC